MLVGVSIPTVCPFLQYKGNEVQKVAAERGIKGAGSVYCRATEGVKLFSLFPFSFAATLFS